MSNSDLPPAGEGVTHATQKKMRSLKNALLDLELEFEKVCRDVAGQIARRVEDDGERLQFGKGNAPLRTVLTLSIQRCDFCSLPANEIPTPAKACRHHYQAVKALLVAKTTGCK